MRFAFRCIRLISACCFELSDTYFVVFFLFFPLTPSSVCVCVYGNPHSRYLSLTLRVTLGIVYMAFMYVMVITPALHMHTHTRSVPAASLVTLDTHGAWWFTDDHNMIGMKASAICIRHGCRASVGKVLPRYGNETKGVTLFSCRWHAASPGPYQYLSLSTDAAGGKNINKK